MPRLPKLALFLSGLFFGGALDHILFIVFDSPTSHYGLQIGTAGQLGFATLDVSLAVLLYVLHGRWAPLAARA